MSAGVKSYWSARLHASGNMPLTADDFSDELSRILYEAEREGRKHIDVIAGEFHREDTPAQTIGCPCVAMR
jgi:hypothetical protein